MGGRIEFNKVMFQVTWLEHVWRLDSVYLGLVQFEDCIANHQGAKILIWWFTALDYIPWKRDTSHFIDYFGRRGGCYLADMGAWKF